jgi:hypothetical protein
VAVEQGAHVAGPGIADRDDEVHARFSPGERGAFDRFPPER